MLELYSAKVCPFAQRTRAVLRHLDEPFDLHEVDLDDRDPRLLELSPTGKVPFLLDGDTRLYESAIINEYLAETRGWEGAFADDPEVRARQRLAMKQWDGTILPPFYGSLGDPAHLDRATRSGVGRELDALEETIRHPAVELSSLLGFHCAPFWARMDWLREYSPLVELVDDRSDLRRWLEDAVSLPAIRETLPDREWTVRRYEERYVGSVA